MTAEKSAAWAAYLLNGGLAKYAEFSGAITAPPQLNDAAKLAAIRLLNSVSDHSGLRQFVAKVELTGRGQNQIPLPGWARVTGQPALDPDQISEVEVLRVLLAAIAQLLPKQTGETKPQTSLKFGLNRATAGDFYLFGRLENWALADWQRQLSNGSARNWSQACHRFSSQLATLPVVPSAPVYICSDLQVAATQILKRVTASTAPQLTVAGLDLWRGLNAQVGGFPNSIQIVDKLPTASRPKIQLPAQYRQAAEQHLTRMVRELAAPSFGDWAQIFTPTTLPDQVLASETVQLAVTLLPQVFQEWSTNG